MAPDLSTTNLLLGIMAAVSLLEAVAVLGVFLAGLLLYRRIIQVINGIEERQVAPAVTRVNAILDDVKGVTSTVKDEAERVDRAVQVAGDLIGRYCAGTEKNAYRPGA
jgi:hypothetical protein